jgi:hypothetical protein
MRRTVFAVALAITLIAATTATAFNTGTHPIRIALLAPPDRYVDRRDEHASDLVRSHVQTELLDLGYDIFVTNLRLTDLSRDDHPRPDYYIDIFGPGGGGYPVAGIGLPVGRNAGVDFAVIVSHVAASVNVYDGRSLELLHTLDLHKKSTTVAPAAIGIGGRPFWAVIAMPFVEWAQYRSGVRAVAHDAAREIDEALHR